MGEVTTYPQVSLTITQDQLLTRRVNPALTTVQSFGEGADLFSGVDAVAASSYQGVSRIFCGSNTGDRVLVFVLNAEMGQYALERKDGNRGDSLGGFETNADAYLEVAGIAVNDQAGEYYVIDQSHQRINVYAIETGQALRSVDLKSFYPEGYDSSKATPLPVDYFSPQGISFDQGSLYVTDNGWAKVFKMTVDGQQDSTFRINSLLADDAGEAYLMQEPECVAVSNNMLFVADENNHVIRVLNATTGELEDTIGQGVFLGDVEGLSVYGGRLFAMDEAAGMIQVFDVNEFAHLGAFALAIDSASGNFSDADGLAVTQQGKVVVADQSRNRVLVFGIPPEFVVSMDQEALKTE